MLSKVKNLGLSMPKKAEVIRDTVFTANAIVFLSAAIFGIDSAIVGVMAMALRL